MASRIYKWMGTVMEDTIPADHWNTLTGTE